MWLKSCLFVEEKLSLDVKTFFIVYNRYCVFFINCFSVFLSLHQNDVDSMESRISVERDRHNAMLKKMDAAVRLNADLKTEYETQLRLFQDLRGKYEEKVTLLTADNKPSACTVDQSAVQSSLQ